MICCRELAQMLIDYVGLELTEDQRRQVEDHLCKCPPCVAYLESYRLIITLSRALPAQPMPQQFVERLQASLK